MSQLPGASPDVPAVVLDDDERIDADLPCVHCGYNLRGLSLEQACPECGTAIGRSVKGDLLCFADPAWVGQLSRGTQFILIAIVVQFCSVFLMGALAAAAGQAASQVAMVVIAIVAGLLTVAGYWLFTSPEPARAEEERGLTARIVARWGQVVALVLGLAGTGFSLVEPNAGVAMNTVAAPVRIAAMIGLGLWAMHLARRVPDLRLAAHTKFVMWGVGVCVGLVALSVAIAATSAAIGGGGGGAPPVGFFMYGSCVGGVGGLVFGIWSLVLLIQYNNRLRAAAEHARQTWAS